MKTTHRGGCHCKAVRYSVEIDLTEPVLECNCSHCAAKGFLLKFVPAEDVTVEQGEDSLTEYRFNRKTVVHLTCSICGVQSFARGEKDGVPLYGINVRTIDDVDLTALTRMPVNGKDF